ncbi:UNVERIFIED_CONTAM: hypothetical protein GTU68_008150 [Idotea baltica]|nr:hypothetical protein [Idotea baltica]
MGTAVPKQYLPLAGSTVIEHSLAVLLRCEFVESVVVVIGKDDQYAGECAGLRRPEVSLCHGGASRSASVLAGLEALQLVAQPDDWVLVHDAVRPCVSIADITKLAQCVTASGRGGILAEKVVDTIKRVDGQQCIVETVKRDDLWRAQTPQMFRIGALHDALARAIEDGREITDEASVMEDCGQPIQLVAGSPSNLKVTIPDDLKTAGLYLLVGGVITMRIGHGYDVHRFSDTDSNGGIVLGGVSIAHPRELLAHSDGDVLIHAVCDALLGAIGACDIGHHFPDTDDAIAGVDSRRLLREVVQQVAAAGWQLANMDSTIIAQTPKMAPHIDSMRRLMAQDLQVATSRVNVKATTTEKLGFAGRSEGIAAHAVVLLEAKA